MASQPNALSRLIENPIFYGAGLLVGFVGWLFRYIEDGHFIIVLIAGIVGLARWSQTRLQSNAKSENTKDGA
jgi:hypothetical protein